MTTKVTYIFFSFHIIYSYTTKVVHNIFPEKVNIKKINTHLLVKSMINFD